MNKYIIGAGILLTGLLLTWGVYVSSDKKASVDVPLVQAALETTQEVYDFGDIDIFGGKVQTTYEIRNTGAVSVTIVSATTSCMCTEGKIDGLTFGMHGQKGGSIVIKPGETKNMIAIFDPLAHGPDGTGPITRDLTLTTNSALTPEVRVKFSGNVVKLSN